jgi:hypothetical protein
MVELVVGKKDRQIFMPTTLYRAVLNRIDTQATTASPAEIAAFLQEHLGQKLTAYLSGLKDPKEVGAWARGDNVPRDLAVMRLRCAYRVVLMILKTYDADTAKAWLFGTNTRLGDEAPAVLLRRARNPEDLRSIVPVARAFAGASD